MLNVVQVDSTWVEVGRNLQTTGVTGGLPIERST